MDPVKPNQLNSEGFEVLLDLHTQGVKAKIIQLFEDIHSNNKHLELTVDDEFLVKEVENIIYESRARLSIFHVDGIPDIIEFLDSNLPAKKLNKLIRETVGIVLSSGDTDEQRKRAIQYIKHTQIGLLREINTKILGEKL